MDSRPRRIDFDALAADLLARAEDLVPQWLAGGRRQGHEWVCGDLAGGEGKSCSVNLRTGKWSDFASGEAGGDLIGLYAAQRGLDRVAAARELLGLEASSAARAPVRPAPPAPPARPDEGWRTVAPVPAGAPRANFNHYHRRAEDIELVSAYERDGQLYGYVVRFRTSDGGKDTLPHTWCQSERNGTLKWHWRQWDEPRPLYLVLGESPGQRTVVLVEGEKKAAALQRVLEDAFAGVYAVVSWPGGSKAWPRAQWSWIAGCTVLLWPDCDAKRQPLTRAERDGCPDEVQRQLLAQAKPVLAEADQPGMKAMLGVGACLRDVHGCKVSLLPIPKPGQVDDGWDCADAIAQGWDAARLQEFFGRAQPLPAGAAAGVSTPTLAGAGSAGSAVPPGGAGAPPAGPGEPPDDGAPQPGMPAWLAAFYDPDKGRWLVSRKLVIQALRHDERLAGVLQVNMLSHNVEATRPWPWPNAVAGPVTNAVDLLLGDYLTQQYRLPSIPRAALSEAIETVAHAVPFHPIRDWLSGLRHDGSPRLDWWLAHVLGHDVDRMAPNTRQYLSIVGRKWLLGMVARVMDPGCKFDYCPVLEGKGGIGKSTLVETLATPEWFSDTAFVIGQGKDGQEQVQGCWLYELAELSHMGRSEANAIKGFISSKVDRFRPSYGRTVEAYPRQVIFVGTTNDKQYLRDRTGNRRFWPIECPNPIDLDWLKDNRDQLFAEAVAAYRAGESLAPDRRDEERLFVPMQERRLVETGVHSELLNLLTRPPGQTAISQTVNELTSFVTLSELVQALGVDAAKSSPALESQIRSWLEAEGWERVRQMRNAVRAWGYKRPPAWPRPDLDDESDDPPAAGERGGDDVPF